MTQGNTFTTKPVHPASLGKRMLLGAGIAFILIAFFLIAAGEPSPEWPKFWMIRPLLIVPLAGASGGAFYYFINPGRYKNSWRRALTIALSLLVYIIGLWLGTVLGLDGTMWN